jgi:hypothetical protein
MALLKDRLLDSSNAFVNNTARTPVVNPFVGAQNGPVLNLGRYTNNAAYISRPVICRVVEFPRWINYMSDPAVFRKAIKTFFEVQTKIDGLQKGLNAEFNEQEIGPAGHRQFDLTKTTITQSDLTHTMTDKYGLPYQNLFTIWMRYGMMDPESMIPLITTLSTSVTDMLPDMYSVTCLYFEPDPRGLTVQKAWLITNMAPRNNGQDEGRRDLTAPGQPLELAIPFTGLQDTSLGVMEFAQAELDKMNREGLNPMTRKAFVSSIDANVAATAGGYMERAAEAASEQI